jgi:hypothetical protein
MFMPTNSLTADRIARIADKVRARADQFGPPLSEDRVCGFERLHGIVLPEGFRAFITQIGDGAFGPPHYGWVPLGHAARDMRPDEAKIWRDLPYVRRPFPFTVTWVWEGGDVSAEGTLQQRNDGLIYLGTDGCGMNWFLVVTGPERGNVWWICGEGMQPTAPKRDFLQWIEDWLDGTTEWWIK